jgi:hypothetical protein
MIDFSCEVNGPSPLTNLYPVQIVKERSCIGKSSTLYGSAALPDDWLVNDTFDITFDLSTQQNQHSSDSQEHACRTEITHRLTIVVKVHPLVEVSRAVMRAARQASIRAAEEHGEAACLAVASHTASLGRSASHSPSVGGGLSNSPSFRRSLSRCEM